MIRSHQPFLVCALGLAVFVAAGCGGGAPRTDIPEASASEQYADNVRMMVLELKSSETPSPGDIVEGMANYEQEAVGEHADTYKQIYEGAQELQQMMESGGSSEEINAKIDELIALTDQLPLPDYAKDSGGAEAEAGN